MKRLKPVLNEQETLIPHHGISPMLPTPPLPPLHFRRHGSQFDLPPEIFFPNTAVRFPFSRSFSTTPTCPLVPPTYPYLFTIFPSTIFSYPPSRAFTTTMTVSSPPTVLQVLPNVYSTTHVPSLTNDTHDPSLHLKASIPVLAAITTLLSPCIRHRIPPVSSVTFITRSAFLPFYATVLSYFTSDISYLSCSNDNDSTTNSMTEALDDNMDEEDNVSNFSSTPSSPTQSQYLEAPADQELSQDSTFFAEKTIDPRSANIRHPSQLHTQPTTNLAHSTKIHHSSHPHYANAFNQLTSLGIACARAPAVTPIRPSPTAAVRPATRSIPVNPVQNSSPWFTRQSHHLPATNIALTTQTAPTAPIPETLVIKYPPRQLIEVGLYSHLLFLKPNRGIEPEEVRVRSALHALEYALQHDGRPFKYEPLLRSTQKNASKELPLININTDNVKPNPLYLLWQANPAITGWLFHILTPYNTKKDIEDLLTIKFITDFSVQLKQPQLTLPDNIHFTPHYDNSEYTEVGWLLFSTPCICGTTLEDEINLQLHAQNPQWIYHHRLVAIKRHVLLPASPSTGPPKVGRTECLWIRTPPALHTEISSALRKIFTQSICKRPMGRGMSFIPIQYAADANYTQIREWHHLYWNNAERFSCITHHDPYDSVLVKGKPITLRAFALSLTDDNGRPLYAAFDRFRASRDKQPYKGRGSRLFTHIDQGSFYNTKFEVAYENAVNTEKQQHPGLSVANTHPSRARTIQIDCYSIDPDYARTIQNGAAAYVTRQHILFPTLNLQPPPPITPLISNPYTTANNPPRTTTAIGHDPKRNCVPDEDHAAK
jgi:hypothetical protein